MTTGSNTGLQRQQEEDLELALPEGFTDVSPEDHGDLKRAASSDANRKPGELPNSGPKVDWYDIKKPGKNDRKDTEYHTYLRVLPHHSKDLRKPWWKVVFRHSFEIMTDERDEQGKPKTKWIKWDCPETHGTDHQCAGTQQRIRLYQRSNELKEEKKPQRDSDSPVRAMAKLFMARKGAIIQAIVFREGDNIGRGNVRDVSSLHTHDDGTLHPAVIRLPSGLGNKIIDLESQRGLLAHPTNGFVVKIIAKKTGPRDQDIDYSVVGADRSQLMPEWFPIFENLVDLDELVHTPETEDDEMAKFRLCIPRACEEADRLMGVETPVGGRQGSSKGFAPGEGESFANAVPRPRDPAAGGVQDTSFDDAPEGPEDDIPF